MANASSSLWESFLPEEVSKGSWCAYQTRMFHILFNGGELLVFSGVGASLQRFLTTLVVGVGRAGRQDMQVTVC